MPCLRSYTQISPQPASPAPMGVQPTQVRSAYVERHGSDGFQIGGSEKSGPEPAAPALEPSPPAAAAPAAPPRELGAGLGPGVGFGQPMTRIEALRMSDASRCFFMPRLRSVGAGSRW